MRLLISFLLTFFVYVSILLFFFYTIRQKSVEKQIVSERQVFIHQAILVKKKVVKKKVNKLVKKVVKKPKKVAQKSDISQSGEDISFDDIFSNVQENVKNTTPVKHKKQSDIVNLKNKNSVYKDVSRKLDAIKNRDISEIKISSNSKMSKKDVDDFYKKVSLIWNELNVGLNNFAVVKFSKNFVTIISTNLTESDKEIFISKLQKLDLSVVDGDLFITFNVKEKN